MSPPPATPAGQLRQLGAAYSAGEVSASEFLQQACAAMSERMRCERVSLWRFEGEGKERRLRCMSMHADDDQDLVVGATLHCTDHAPLFAALEADGLLAASDTFTDARVATVLEHYLRPLDIRALVDVVFSVNGQAFGVLCCAQLHAPRQWLAQDLAELRRVASVISLTLAKPPGGADPTDPMPLVDVEVPDVVTEPAPLSVR